MPRRFHGEPGKPVGVVVAVREPIERAFEPVARVWKPRLKFCRHFSAYLIARLADAGTEGSDHVFWLRTEVHLHTTQRFCRNAANRAAPAGMNRSDRAALRIREQDRNAVGRLYDEQNAWLASDESVTLRGCFARIGSASRLVCRINYLDNVGMNLPQCDNPHFVRANRADEFLPVVKNTRAWIPVREAQIEHFFASIFSVAQRLQFAYTARSCAEAVNEPVEPCERRPFKDLQAAG